MIIKNYRIIKVSNGWILDTAYYDRDMIARSDETYVFSTSKKLAKFIKKLDEKETENDN